MSRIYTTESMATVCKGSQATLYVFEFVSRFMLRISKFGCPGSLTEKVETELAIL